MHKAMNWSLVAQRTICSSTPFAGDTSLDVRRAEKVSEVARVAVTYTYNAGLCGILWVVA